MQEGLQIVYKSGMIRQGLGQDKTKEKTDSGRKFMVALAGCGCYNVLCKIIAVVWPFFMI